MIEYTKKLYERNEYVNIQSTYLYKSKCRNFSIFRTLPKYGLNYSINTRYRVNPLFRKYGFSLIYNYKNRI
jgi:hypothetical protein